MKIVNVKNFGAVGDGVTDDTEAVSAAIDAASNNGKLMYEPGTYIVSSLFKSAVDHFTMESLIPGTVTIKRKVGMYSNNPDTSTSGIITFVDSSYITVKGITFDGNKANAVPQAGITATNVINFAGCDNVFIDAISVTNGHFLGCSLQMCDNQKIINSTFQDWGWAGLNIGGGRLDPDIVGSADVWIENNRFYNSWSGLVVSVYVDRVDVVNNIFVNATCNFSQAVRQAKISSNKFYGKGPASPFGEVAFSAITCECDNDIIIDGNDIIDSALYGIYVYGSYIQSGPDEGIITSDNIQITNNKIRQCQNTGIVYSGGSPYTYDPISHTGTPTTEINSTKGNNCIIHGNIVSQCEGSGIGVGLSNNVIISNNQSFLNQLHGISLGSCDKVDVKNNFIYNNSKAGTDNYNGIDLGTNTSVQNVTISNNFIYDDQTTRTQRFAIMANNSLASDIRIRDNIMHGNGGEIYSVVDVDPYVIITATLEAGTTAQAGYEAPKFYRDGDNIVHLVGSAVVGLDITQRLFTLLVGYRPAIKQRLITVANGALGIIEVGTDGFVIPVVSTASQYVNLSGLSFKAKPYLT